MPLDTTEVRTVSSTGGEKGVKEARYDLIPASPLREVAELYGKGAEKYADRNWELGYEWNKSFGALMRHAWLFWNGEDEDVETLKHHMASVVFHAFALMEFGETHPEFDNRPSTVAKRKAQEKAQEDLAQFIEALVGGATGGDEDDDEEENVVEVEPSTLPPRHYEFRVTNPIRPTRYEELGERIFFMH